MKLTPITPRCLNRESAAEYCGCSPSAFDDWVRRGIVPGPLRGTKQWDRKAIDVALDKMSGLETETTSTDPHAAATMALQRWLAERGDK